MTRQEFLTPAELARRYPVGRAAVYAACAAGRLAHYRVPSRPGARGKYLVAEADFLAWLGTLRHEAGGPPATAGPPAKPVTPPLRHLRLS